MTWHFVVFFLIYRHTNTLSDALFLSGSWPSCFQKWGITISLLRSCQCQSYTWSVVLTCCRITELQQLSSSWVRLQRLRKNTVGWPGWVTLYWDKIFRTKPPKGTVTERSFWDFSKKILELLYAKIIISAKWTKWMAEILFSFYVCLSVCLSVCASVRSADRSIRPV